MLETIRELGGEFPTCAPGHLARRGDWPARLCGRPSGSDPRQYADRALTSESSGRWFVRAGFGPSSEPHPDGFATLQEVSVWVGSLVGWGDAIAVS